MNKLYYYLIIITLIFYGCKEDEAKNIKMPGGIASIDFKNKITEINDTPIEIKIDLSKVIEGNFYEYFNLKNIIHLDDNFPIGEISLIKQNKDKLFILDKKNALKLFCFNLQGNLIWEFNSKGNGPLEYGKMSDFVINIRNSTIDVLDNKRYKIINLDIETGIAKTEFNLGCHANEMVLCDNEYLLYTNNKTITSNFDYKLLLVNTDKKVTSRNLPFSQEESKKHLTGFSSLGKYDEMVFFNETFNDTIYTIKNDTLRRAYHIDFMDKKYPKNLLTNFTVGKAKKANKINPYILSIDRLGYKNGILTFSFLFKNEFYSVFYDTKKQRTYLFNRLKNGPMAGNHQQILLNGYIDNGFISYIDPFILNKDKELMKLDKNFESYLKMNKSKIYNVLLNINENSNPVLFVYEFKKNI